VFFLDQDDYLADDALEAMVAVADENGTDVVVPRMRGLGGRTTPLTMFERTLPRADVFASSAYWTLNPIKLFRTGMVESLGLRFGEDFPLGEDLPFVAPAYLKGAGISILADKDYVFWVNREDGSNITARAFTLAQRLPSAIHMFELVAEALTAGSQRDALMRRNFQVELLGSVFEGYRAEIDPVTREAAFEQFRGIVAAYYTERIESAFPPRGRVLMRLVSEGRAAEFGDYLDALAQTGPPDVLVEGGQIYLAIPWFRDPDKPLPDALFEIGARLKIQRRVERIVVEAAGVRVVAEVRMGALTGRVTGVSLVLRPRTGEADVAIPLAHEVLLDEVSPRVAVEDVIPFDRLLAGAPDGAYDLYLRVAAGETVRERKVDECAPPPRNLRIVRYARAGARARYGILSTTAKGHLTLAVVDRSEMIRRRLRHLRRSIGRVVGPRSAAHS
jgi:hypothetical protein